MPKMNLALRDLPLTLESPHIELKEQILDTLLKNPFLDEDLQGMSLRLGAPRGTMAEALDGLCQAHVLKAVGKRGYILDIAHIAASEPASPEAPEAHIAAGTNQDTPLLQKIFDAFPSGALLLAADGRQIATNEQMALLLGIPRAELDAEAFTRLTGIALDAVGVEQEMRQVLDYPPGLEVIVRLCPLEAEEGGVFIVARQAGEAQESMQAQALFQEELFAGLQAHLVKPLMRIEQFLGNPDSSGLAQARAALERVNWFLGDLFLAQKTGIVPIDIEDYEER